MHIGRFTPWDCFPRCLRFSEVQDPLKVLLRFFGDRMNTHRDELKMWRDFALSDKQYKNKREGSGHLLFIYDQNVRLLEACYLLFLAYREEPWKKKAITDEVLKKGKEQWAFYPDELAEKYQHSPYLLLKKLFEKISLPEYRDYLTEWTHTALYTFPIDETLLPGEMVTVYENMLKLYSAAWLIHQTESKEPFLKREFWTDVVPEVPADKGEQENKEEKLCKQIVPEEVENDVTQLHPFSPRLTPAEKLGLDHLVGSLLKFLPSIRSITYLGSYPEPFTFYLLILVDEEVKMPEHSIVNKIEDNFKALTNIYAIVHKVGSAVNGLKSKGKFWNLAFGKGINIYRSEDLKLPEPQKISPEQDMAVRLASWNKYGIMSKEFFHGAERYMEEGNVRLALFLLHQATEHALTGLLQVMFGYRQSVHNLFKLIKLTLLFTDEFRDIFEIETKEGLVIFTLINDGYSKARYDENFLIEEDMVETALEKVGLLMDKAKLVFKGDKAK
jgi:HEPN domain-containing protein